MYWNAYGCICNCNLHDDVYENNIGNEGIFLLSPCLFFRTDCIEGRKEAEAQGCRHFVAELPGVSSVLLSSKARSRRGPPPGFGRDCLSAGQSEWRHLTVKVGPSFGSVVSTSWVVEILFWWWCQTYNLWQVRLWQPKQSWPQFASTATNSAPCEPSQQVHRLQLWQRSHPFCPPSVWRGQPASGCRPPSGLASISELK